MSWIRPFFINSKNYGEDMLTKQNYIKVLKQYSDIEIELNRLHSQKAALQNKIKVMDKTERKSRTRTLIQLGGLLNISPLLSLCEIQLGDDLQISHQDKADMLLGIISALCDNLPEQIDETDLNHFKNLGTSLRISHEMNKKKKLITKKSKGDENANDF